MRITNSMMSKQFLSESNDALSRVSKYQSQVDSSKRLTSIADDPQATLMALKARNKLSNLEMYRTNISTASSYLTEAESAVSELNEILQSAYEDVISAQSSKTPSDLKILAEDIQNLQNEVLSVSNATIGTSYIFGGYNYTGSTSGVTKTPPFSVSGVTGDLSYNGINLSQVSWKEDYDNDTSKMSSLRDTVVTIASAFTTSASDIYNKNQAQTAFEALSSLVSKGKAAMKDAEEFGIDTNSAEYQSFKTFWDSISTVADDLGKETSKDIAGDYILDTAATVFKSDGTIDYDYYNQQGISVLTADELANKFSSANVQTVLASASALLDNSGGGAPMDAAVSQLKTAMATVLAPVQPALTAEAGKKTTIQIGTSQSMDVTVTGLELLNTGSCNIYHILGKCVKMLNGDMSTDGLQEMVTTLQNAQSSALTLQTKIGASQNRLTFIGNRYDSSELNYTKMKSDAEDADLAESIVNLTTAQAVYNAALAGGAKIIKTSLIDFLT